jgi:hypothetical protein
MRYIRTIETTIPTLTQRMNLKLMPPATAEMPPVLLPNVARNAPPRTSINGKNRVDDQKSKHRNLKNALVSHLLFLLDSVNRGLNELFLKADAHWIARIFPIAPNALIAGRPV